MHNLPKTIGYTLAIPSTTIQTDPAKSVTAQFLRGKRHREYHPTTGALEPPVATARTQARLIFVFEDSLTLSSGAAATSSFLLSGSQISRGGGSSRSGPAIDNTEMPFRRRYQRNYQNKRSNHAIDKVLYILRDLTAYFGCPPFFLCILLIGIIKRCSQSRIYQIVPQL